MDTGQKQSASFPASFYTAIFFPKPFQKAATSFPQCTSALRSYWLSKTPVAAKGVEFDVFFAISAGCSTYGFKRGQNAEASLGIRNLGVAGGFLIGQNKV